MRSFGEQQCEKTYYSVFQQTTSVQSDEEELSTDCCIDPQEKIESQRSDWMSNLVHQEIKRCSRMFHFFPLVHNTRLREPLLFLGIRYFLKLCSDFKGALFFGKSVESLNFSGRNMRKEFLLSLSLVRNSKLS